MWLIHWLLQITAANGSGSCVQTHSVSVWRTCPNTWLIMCLLQATAANGSGGGSCGGSGDGSGTAKSATDQEGAQPVTAASAATKAKESNATPSTTAEVPAEMGGYDLKENETTMVPESQKDSAPAKNAADLTFDDMMAMPKVRSCAYVTQSLACLAVYCQYAVRGECKWCKTLLPSPSLTYLRAQ